MRTRSTRKLKRGGGTFDFFTGKKTEQPQDPNVQGPSDIQVPDGPQNPTPENSIIDQKAKEITGLQGYHMRAIINAISVCNSTMKMQNNAAGVGNSVLNAFGTGNEAKLEMSKCGSQCIARSDTVKEALKTLLDVAGETPVLGYIASGTGAMNSANYLGNSALSLGNKASAVGSNAANQASQAASALGNKASEAASSVGNFFSGLTRKATQPQTTGGRRRKRTRR